MPYIKKEQREQLDGQIQLLYNAVHAMGLKESDKAGVLNYIISELLDVMIPSDTEKWNYSAMNNTVGVLECAKLELYRRLVAPYEDTKIKENGDIGTYE